MEGLEALYALKYQAAELTDPEVTMQKIANDAVFIENKILRFKNVVLI